MDEYYTLSYQILKDSEIIIGEQNFDNLTEAIQAVNQIANGSSKYEYIHLVWGCSVLLELYGD